MRQPGPVRLVIGAWPAAFSIVMATGILAVAARDFGLRGPSELLLALAVAAALGLVGFQGRTLVRRMLSPELAPASAFGSLTFVAGTAVMGARVAGYGTARYAAGLVLWGIALVAWCGLGRAPAVLLGPRRAAVDPEEVRGEWCLAAVAPFSLAVLAGGLAALRGSRVLLLAAAVLWIVGGLAYLLAAFALAGRLVRRPPALADVTPDWWITMGGLSIATVAALSLAGGARRSGLLSGGADEMALVARVTWWGATLLIPPLVCAFALRAMRVRPWPDLARLWAAVFPVGMYAVASHALAVEIDSPALDGVGRVAFWIALAGWLAAGAGTARVARERTAGG
jgi:tellurite resistance protein TehA-like permease